MHSLTDSVSALRRRPRRRWLASLFACAAALTGSLAAPAHAADVKKPTSVTDSTSACKAWPLWQRFTERFIQADGRVIDHSTARQHSTSEGQSYAMFFALVAGDQEQFDLLWRWSINNLSAQDISKQLPAWQWGQRDDGSWGVVDNNSASDADLWFAYSLAEAGRLWGQGRYTKDAKTLLDRIAAEEVTELPGFGPMLLPARTGFTLAPDKWRLNPSYLPMPLLRRLNQIAPEGPWQAIATNTMRMLDQSTPLGFAADWLVYQSAVSGPGRFVSDAQTADLGSYDAIRTYLWAGMTSPADPLRAPLLAHLGGIVRVLGNQPLPPEKVQIRNASLSGTGPVGFSAALLPYLSALNKPGLLEVQRDRVKRDLIDPGGESTATYYDYVLGLFGTGWDQKRYHFLPSGKLKIRLETACPPTAATR